MEEGDEYVPQISQIDYNLMDGNGSAPPYYGSNMNMPNFYGTVPNQPQMSGYQHQIPPGSHGLNLNMQPMNPGPPSNQQQNQQKKRGGGRKKATATPTQQPPQQPPMAQNQTAPSSMPSYPMHQMGQSSSMPYGYPPQQKWPPTAGYHNSAQPPYPGNVAHPNQGYPNQQQMQNYYAAQAQRPQFYGMQPQPHQPYNNQQHAAPRPPMPPQQQQPYFMDPNMYNYPGHNYTHPQQMNSQNSMKPGEIQSQMTMQQRHQMHQYKPPQNPPMSSPMPGADFNAMHNNQPPPPQQTTGMPRNPQWGNGYPEAQPGYQPNYYHQQQTPTQQLATTNQPQPDFEHLQSEIAETERQYLFYKSNPQGKEMCTRIEQRLEYLRRTAMQMHSQQQTSTAPTQQERYGMQYSAPNETKSMETTSTQILPASSAGTQSHQPDMNAMRPPMSSISHDTKPSVSVMQTASSQVQVNITPEAPGRTLISVNYHQYQPPDALKKPSDDKARASVSPGKDSIPPEPIPSLNADNYQPYKPYVNKFSNSAAANNATRVDLPTANSSNLSGPAISANATNMESKSLLEQSQKPFMENGSLNGALPKENGSPKAALESIFVPTDEETLDKEPDDNSSEEKNSTELIDDLKPPHAPRAVPFNESDDIEPMNESFNVPTLHEEEVTAEKPPEKIEEPVAEVNEEKLEETEDAIPVVAEPLVTEEASTLLIESKLEAIEQNSVETSQSEAPESESQSVPSNEKSDAVLEIAEASESEAKAEIQTPKPKKAKAKTPKRPPPTANRKRRRNESEDEQSEGEDFVPSMKKKSTMKAAASRPLEASVAEINEFVEKRRSDRNRNERKTYDEKAAFDEELDMDELLSQDSPPPRPQAPEWIVEKILGVRLAKLEDEEKNSKTEVTEKKEDDDDDDDEEEILVKYKGKSYIHCEWKSVEELELLDKRIVGKINRFKTKFGDSYLDDTEYFNEDYTIVDRVLAEETNEETGEQRVFVKWRSMPYEDCTWEELSVAPQSKISEFHQRNENIDQCKVKERDRPGLDEWEKITADKSYKDGNSLREYQTEGVNWLLFCYFNRQNCILADEMGLGKTIQTITFLQGVHDKGIHGPFLIVVPLSTLHNWEREFETWTGFNTVVYHGGAASREIIQNYELYYDKADSKKRNVFKFDALLTTFEMVVSDCEVLRKINYRVCVIDEAHRLKNRNSKLLTGGLLSFRMEHRVLLTGTPLQNNIQELFSLLNFLEPEQFHSSEQFLEQFGQCQTEEQVQKLQEILKPMMLRRLKEDVEKTLQPKEETIIEVQLSNIQKKYYRAILERNFTHLLKGASMPSLMNTMMELRKCCNHPFLIKGAEDQIIAELKQQHDDKNEEFVQNLALVQSSGKLVLIDKLLPKLRQDGHKVLIFSQMVRVLDLLEEFLIQMSYSYERLDGNIRGDLRQAAIDRFSKPDSDRFVFLLCTRAGGLGINLTAADTVIIFDSDWNPQNDLQAQARCHRIGQTKMVKVYRLITANTYEREMFDKASLKLGLDKAVLQSMTPKENNQQLTRKEVEDLLRKGAYGAVMDEDNEGSKFSEEDIDTILQRRTQTIRLEPGVKGSTFAKASFTSSSNREDIDVNDPNFWSKWAKKANVDMESGDKELIVSEPRSRRKRYEEPYKVNDGDSDDGEATDDDSSARGVRSNADFSKNRSGKKRRRDDDEDYVSYQPDELSFNKSEYFKVEKLLATWGWGRWTAIKQKSDVGLSENDIEHISRTLLLHCIREYRGDEKTREFVWQLIVPSGGALGKGDKKGVVAGGLYHEGWAALPEYNPPAFAVDSSFQRHVHRHANKLLQRMLHLFILQRHMIGKADEDIMGDEKSYTAINLEVPSVGDFPMSIWDSDCDKCLVIGIYKHGMENFEAIRADSKLCYIEKKIDEMPSTVELNTRFKRIILLVYRKIEMAMAASHTQNRWSRVEENDFMRILRLYGVKDDNEGVNVINWNRFREMSTHLHKKSDAEMLEQLYCVLAMCTKQQGGELSAVDQRRAAMVDAISPRRAEKLMCRLHLMRKIHAIITTGIHNVRTSLKLCSAETMYPGWGEVQDEQLLIIVDMHGLDDIVGKASKLPTFSSFRVMMDEASLVRRVMEICTTLETGRWNGRASVDMLDDDDSLAGTDAQAMLQKIIAAATGMGTSTPQRSSNTSSSAKKATKRKVSNAGTTPATSAASASASSAATVQALMEATMSNAYLLPFLGAMSGGASMTAQQQQQLSTMLAMCALTAPFSMPGASASTSSATSQSASAKQLQNALLAAMCGASEDALNLSPKKNVSRATASTTKSKPVDDAAKFTEILSSLAKAQEPKMISESRKPVKTEEPKKSEEIATTSAKPTEKTPHPSTSTSEPAPRPTPKTNDSAHSLSAADLTGQSSLDALQTQLMLQQLMLSSSMMSSPYGNPYAAMMGTSSTSGASRSTADSNADTNALALALLLSGQMPSTSLPTTLAKETPTASSSMVASSSKAAQDEAALAAELINSPAVLASLLNANSLNSASTSANPTNLSAFGISNDLQTLMQLSALTSAAQSVGGITSTADSKKSSTARNSGSGKLSAVLEKLSSSHSNSVNNNTS